MSVKDKKVIDEGLKVLNNVAKIDKDGQAIISNIGKIVTTIGEVTGVVAGAGLGKLIKLDADGAKDDEKHANTDYSKFGGLKHFLYAGY